MKLGSRYGTALRSTRSTFTSATNCANNSSRSCYPRPSFFQIQRSSVFLPLCLSLLSAGSSMQEVSFRSAFLVSFFSPASSTDYLRTVCPLRCSPWEVWLFLVFPIFCYSPGWPEEQNTLQESFQLHQPAFYTFTGNFFK